jgi:hypothetical protein
VTNAGRHVFCDGSIGQIRLDCNIHRLSQLVNVLLSSNIAGSDPISARSRSRRPHKAGRIELNDASIQMVSMSRIKSGAMFLRRFVNPCGNLVQVVAGLSWFGHLRATSVPARCEGSASATAATGRRGCLHRLLRTEMMTALVFGFLLSL